MSHGSDGWLVGCDCLDCAMAQRDVRRLKDATFADLRGFLADAQAKQIDREVLGMLKAQVDDHYAELVQLRARVVELERIIRRTDQVQR